MGQGAGSRVGTGRFQAMGQTAFQNLYSPPTSLRQRLLRLLLRHLHRLQRLQLLLHQLLRERLLLLEALQLAPLRSGTS
jgi:hypothetical protein